MNEILLSKVRLVSSRFLNQSLFMLRAEKIVNLMSVFLKMPYDSDCSGVRHISQTLSIHLQNWTSSKQFKLACH